MEVRLHQIGVTGGQARKDAPVNLHGCAPYLRHLVGIGFACSRKVFTGINVREVFICQNGARTEELVQALGKVLLLKRSLYHVSFLLDAATDTTTAGKGEEDA